MNLCAELSADEIGDAVFKTVTAPVRERQIVRVGANPQDALFRLSACRREEDHQLEQLELRTKSAQSLCPVAAKSRSLDFGSPHGGAKT
jgi:hypothetical protein